MKKRKSPEVPSMSMRELFHDAEECSVHNNNKRGNCKDNVCCLARLGQDKWAKVEMKEEEGQTRTGRSVIDTPCGLTNLGNTCYMNSFLQLYFNDLQFRDAVFTWRPSDLFVPPPSPRMNVQSVMNALQHLFVQMLVTPYDEASAADLVKELRLDTDQQDAQEFATLFLGALVHNLQAHPNGRPLCDLINNRFAGELKRVIACKKCGTRSERVAHFQSLQLSIKQQKTLSDALQGYFSEEPLDDYQCDGCKSRGQVTSKAQLTSIPPVLIVQLNRYYFDANARKKKFTHAVAFGRTVNFSRYAATGTKAAQKAEYRLCAAMVHQGTSADSGHYFDLIKDETSGRWFKYNDETVTKLTKAPGVDVEAPITKGSDDQKGCYALIYRRQDADPPVCPEPPSPLTEDVREHLTQQFNAECNRDERTVKLKTQRLREKITRLRDLWSRLQIRSVADTSSILFLPTKLLMNIQTKEFEIINETDQSSEETKKKEELLDERFVDKPAAVDTVQMTLCPHGLLPLTVFRSGEWKAVNADAAIQLLTDYRIGIPEHLFSIGEICPNCRKEADEDERFRSSLEQDWQLLQTASRSELNHQASNSVEHSQFWVGNKSLTAFKKMALARRTQSLNETGGIQKRIMAFESQSNSSQHPPSPKRVKPTEHVSASKVDSENGVEEDCELKIPNGTPPTCNYYFNYDIKCPHGSFLPNVKRKTAFSVGSWNTIKKYFDSDCFEVSTDALECHECVSANEKEITENCRLDDIAEQLKNYAPWLKPALLQRKWSEMNAESLQEEQRARFALCRRFADDLIKFLRSVKNRGELPKICQEHLLCSEHARPMFPMDEEECASVPLTANEWSHLIRSPFFADQQPTAVAVVGAGRTTNFDQFCVQCYDIEMQKRQEDHYYYNQGTIFVDCVNDTAGDPPPEDALLRRSARPRRGKDQQSLKVSSSDTVQQLKVRLSGIVGALPSSMLLWTTDGRELDSEKTLQESRVASMDVLRLVIETGDADDDDTRPRELERGFQNTALAQL